MLAVFERLHFHSNHMVPRGSLWQAVVSNDVSTWLHFHSRHMGPEGLLGRLYLAVAGGSVCNALVYMLSSCHFDYKATQHDATCRASAVLKPDLSSY